MPDHYPLWPSKYHARIVGKAKKRERERERERKRETKVQGYDESKKKREEGRKGKQAMG
jgi:hypothetical protein